MRGGPRSSARGRSPSADPRASPDDPFELVAVGRGDVGERQQKIAHGHRPSPRARRARRHRPSPGRRHRARSGSSPSPACTQGGDVDRLAGIAEIAGQHGGDLAQPRCALEILHEGGELVRRPARCGSPGRGRDARAA